MPGPALDGGQTAGDAPSITPPSDGAAPPPAGRDGGGETIPAPAADAAPPASTFKGDVTSELELYLRLDDGKGATLAHDASGQGAVAALHSINPQDGWMNGRLGGAVGLHGASWSGWIEAAGSNLTDAVSSAFTLAMWIWRSDATSGGLLSRRSLGARGYLFALTLENGALALQLNSTAAYNLHTRGNGTVPQGRWVHVAATFDLQVATLYVDGVAVGAAPYLQPVPLDTTPYVVGGLEQQDASVSSLFSGGVDEVAVYSRALTAAQIAGLAGGAQPPNR
jgi:large repetitive protein